MSILRKIVSNPGLVHETHQLANKVNREGIISDPEGVHDKLIKKIREQVDDTMMHELFTGLGDDSHHLGVTRKPEGKDELYFRNPLLLSAGFNKKVDGLNYFDHIFGGQMIGGVTSTYTNGGSIISGMPRIKKDLNSRSMVNWGGFDNLGAAATSEKISKLIKQGLWSSGPVGVNIVGDASEYVYTLKTIGSSIKEHPTFWELDFSGLNHTSADSIQTKYSELRNVIRECKKANEHYNKPIVIKLGILSNFPGSKKLSKDLTDDILEKSIMICIEEGVDGINVTSTSKERRNVHNMNSKVYNKKNDLKNEEGIFVGGMSGKLIQDRALETAKITREILDREGSNILLIGTGGIGCDGKYKDIGKHALAFKNDAKADLLGIFTGFVLSASSPKKILKELLQNKRAKAAPALQKSTRDI